MSGSFVVARMLGPILRRSNFGWRLGYGTYLGRD